MTAGGAVPTDVAGAARRIHQALNTGPQSGAVGDIRRVADWVVEQIPAQGEAVPTATPLVDVLLDEVTRLRLHLAAEQSEHRQTRAKLDAARRTADREWCKQNDEISRLRAQLDQLRAHRDVPLSRQALGVAACAVTVVVGVADRLRDRWRRRG